MSESTTERLRKLLDNHGIDHLDKGDYTLWGKLQDSDWYANNASPSSNGLNLHMHDVSPEQAIEATLGGGDVRDEVHISRLSNGFQCDGSVWRCCRCGAFFTCYTDLTTYHKPRFCPNCGAKVVQE